MQRYLMAGVAALALTSSGAFAADKTVGFAQIGSESGWRAAETTVTKQQAAELAEFLESVGLKEPGLNSVIRTGYELLGLLTFLTAGEKECRAWTVRKGSTAPECAGAIHSDFQRGFIKAEVIWWEDLIKYGSEAKCRDAGKLAIEGKEYVVRDGDVIHFRFNV